MLLTPITSVFFPFMLITVKAVALFNNGIELHKLSDTLTFAEGQVESLCQTGLQLYIIFKRDDRNEKKLVEFFLVSVSTYITCYNFWGKRLYVVTL